MFRGVRAGLLAAAALVWLPLGASAQGPGKTKNKDGVEQGSKAKAPGGKAKTPGAKAPGGKTKAPAAKAKAPARKPMGAHGKAPAHGQPGHVHGKAAEAHAEAAEKHAEAAEEHAEAAEEHAEAAEEHAEAAVEEQGADAMAKATLKHYDRMARIDRIAALAKAGGNAALGAKAEALRVKELARHGKAMQRHAEKGGE